MPESKRVCDHKRPCYNTLTFGFQKKVGAARVGVLLFMPTMGHGARGPQVRRGVESDGSASRSRYLAERFFLTMGGCWTITVTLTQPDGSTLDGSFEVRLP